MKPMYVISIASLLAMYLLISQMMVTLHVWFYYCIQIVRHENLQVCLIRVHQLLKLYRQENNEFFKFYAVTQSLLLRISIKMSSAMRRGRRHGANNVASGILIGLLNLVQIDRTTN